MVGASLSTSPAGVTSFRAIHDENTNSNYLYISSSHVSVVAFTSCHGPPASTGGHGPPGRATGTAAPGRGRDGQWTTAMGCRRLYV